MTIKSRSFNYGHELEADWPPQFGTKDENTASVYHWDPETKSMKEGRAPNPHPKLAEAPNIIFDSMPAQYHEGACRVIDSRAEWNRADEETGSLTFSSTKEPRRHIEKRNKEYALELKKDRRRASEEALKMVRANPKEIHEKLQKQGEKQREEAKKSGLTKLLKEQGVV